MVKNAVFISKQYHNAAESKSGVVVNSMNIISQEISLASQLHMKYRHGADIHQVTITRDGDAWVISLQQESKQGIATGHFAVLYEGHNVLVVELSIKLFKILKKCGKQKRGIEKIYTPL